MSEASEAAAAIATDAEAQSQQQHSWLWNPDLAAVPPERRTWGTYNYAALWVALSVNIPTYLLASGMIAGGMNWKQAIFTVFLGNLIVLVPMVLNAHAGTKYGIPFPVFARASFGVLGANIPALLRAIVACGWFGIQTWIGGAAIYQLLAIPYPEISDTAHMPAWLGGNYHLEAEDLYVTDPGAEHESTATGTIQSIDRERGELQLASKGDEFRVVLSPAAVFVKGDHSPADLASLQSGAQVWIEGQFKGTRINFAQFLCFIFFWLLNMIVVWAGIETIRWFENLSAPFLLLIGLGLLAWAYREAHGFGPMFSQGSGFKSSGEFFAVFFPSLTAMVGFWATLSLNIPDFTRYARSQRDQIVGQALGLPTTMALYSFIGIAVTSATFVIFGRYIWDPVALLAEFKSKSLVILSMVSLSVATLSTNIAANVVSPANDFSNVWPRKISFKIGGTITGIVGILIMPWRLLERPDVYIFTWLIGYGALLGPIGGVLIADYFVVRRARLHLKELYQMTGRYAYSGGFNLVAVFALLMGIWPNVPGFLAQVSLLNNVTDSFTLFLIHIYDYSWFTGFFLSFVTYCIVTQAAGNPGTREA